MKGHCIPVIVIIIASLALGLGLGACGGDEPDPSATPAPTATPASTAIPAPTATKTVLAPMSTPAPTESPSVSAGDALAQYAAEHAGGPGAIFVGDPIQMIGPPPHEGLMFGVAEEQYK